MAVPYILDAETGTSEFTLLRQDASNTVTQSTTKKHTGANSFRVFFGDPADRDCYGQKDTDETGLTESYCRFYVNLSDVDADTPSGYEIMNIWKDNNATYHSQLFIYPQGGGGFGLECWYFHDGGSGVIYTNPSGTDINADDTWHAIEIRIKKATTASSNDGIHTLWLDDVELGTLTNIDNFDKIGTGSNKFVFGGDNAGAPNIGSIIWYDDIEINTSKIGLLPTATLEQEGFRFRNDDDDEANASWRQNQDVNDSITTNNNIRLRVLIDSAGDFTSSLYTLQYKETGDSEAEYRKVKL